MYTAKKTTKKRIQQRKLISNNERPISRHPYLPQASLKRGSNPQSKNMPKAI